MALSKKVLLPAILLVAPLLVVVLAQVAVSQFFSAKDLEALLEENLNASVRVEEVKVSLLSRKVTLSGLSLKPRKPTGVPSEISVSEVRLGVKALPLLSRRLEATALVISKPEIEMALDKDGNLSIESLFREPGEDSEEEEDKEGDGGVLQAKENAWLAKLDEARIENGRVRLLLEKDGLDLTVGKLAIELTDLQFDPEDLRTLNEVKMKLGGHVQLQDEEKVVLMNLDLDGSANGKLFDPVTGDFSADVVADLALGAESYLNPQVKIVRRTWSYLEKVEKIGISLGDLPDRIGFGRSGRIVGTYHDDKVQLSQPLSLVVGKWEVGLARDSWIALESGQHEIGVEFLAGGKVGEKLSGWLRALPSEVRSLAEQRFVDEEQILWRVESSGDLKDPEFDFNSQLPEAKGLLKDLKGSFDEEVENLKDKAKDEARGFLKGLLD